MTRMQNRFQDSFQRSFRRSSSSSSINLGCGSFIGLLQILFLGLKLAGFIDWPWWQVMLPLIIWAVFVIIILAAIAIWFCLRIIQDAH